MRTDRSAASNLDRAILRRALAMDIGFIGLGHMGQAMARTLLKAGFRLTVYNRTRARAEELQAEGAAVADSPAEASRGDLVITMLPDAPPGEAVVFGEQDVIPA